MVRFVSHIPKVIFVLSLILVRDHYHFICPSGILNTVPKREKIWFKNLSNLSL